MRGGNRKSAPRVRDGKVQKKNRTALSPSYWEHEYEDLVVRRFRPVDGLYHAVSPTDVRRFVALLDDWEKVSKGVRAIVLLWAGRDCYGRYNHVGVIMLAPWSKSGVIYAGPEDIWLLGKMGIDAEVDQEVTLSREQARCFQLLGTFLHELGHHIDRMSTKSRKECSNGEPFAYHYEQRRQKELWNAYVNEFGIPE